MSDISNDIGKTKKQMLLEELAKLDNDDCNETDDKVTAPKKKLTPKQIENLNKGRQLACKKKQEASAKKRLEEIEIENEVRRRCDEYRKQLEEKIVKKAISIKKKEIKKQAILEEISDDDTPITKIKEVVKKTKQKEPIEGSKPVKPIEEPKIEPKFIFI